MEHYRAPKGQGEVNSEESVSGVNPLCGDRISLHAAIDGGRIHNIQFQSRACSICVASASIMTTLCENQSVENFNGLFQMLHRAFEQGSVATDEEMLTVITATTIKSRQKCALLAWEALSEFVKQTQELAD